MSHKYKAVQKSESSEEDVQGGTARCISDKKGLK